MKIGIDASCWANKRGYGRYTRELVRTLLSEDDDNQYRLFLDSETALQAQDLVCGIDRVVVRTSQAATRAASASGRRSLRDLWAMRQAVHHYGRDLDVLYFPSVYTFFPPKTRAGVIVTIHDTTPERYPELIFPNRSSRMFWRLKVRMAIRRADIIATVSEASRREIVRVFGVSPRRVKVVSDAVGDEFYRLNGSGDAYDGLGRYGIGPRDAFILYVGGISPHKNLDTLVEAFGVLCEQDESQEYRLVLAGDYQQDVFYSCYAALSERIAALGLSDRVVFTGFVDDADLLHLYNRARAVVVPSFDEGFGLPALEAMACGTPVIASRAGALPEVVSGAGLLFRPDSPEELCDCLRAIINDGRLAEELGLKGLRRAEEFSWSRSAQQALAMFKEAAWARR